MKPANKILKMVIIFYIIDEINFRIYFFVQIVLNVYYRSIELNILLGWIFATSISFTYLCAQSLYCTVVVRLVWVELLHWKLKLIIDVLFIFVVVNMCSRRDLSLSATRENVHYVSVLLILSHIIVLSILFY